MNATTKDLRYALQRLTRAMQSAEIPTDRLHLETGSKTYGRAYRLYNRDPQSGGLSTVPGMDSSGYLGMTKSETEQALRMIATGIEMVVARDVEANR